MNKSFFALVFALPLIAGCWGKKAEVEVIAPAATEEVATEATHDEASHEEVSHDEVVSHDEENDEK